jgi:hypothetical protein
MELPEAAFWPQPATPACVVAAATRHGVPVPIAHTLMKVEGGRAGTVSRNKNGTVDMGVLQINTVWLPEMAQKTGLPNDTIAQLLINNGCFNVGMGLAILARHYDREKEWGKAIAAYHSKTPKYGARYLQRFLERGATHDWAPGFSR